MRVRSGELLPSYVLEPHPKRPGYTTIRLRENAKPYTETRDGQTISGYEYDEYCLIAEDRESLQADVESNFDAYIAQAKAQEEQDTPPEIKIARVRSEAQDMESYLLDVDYKLALMEITGGGEI